MKALKPLKDEQKRLLAYVQNGGRLIYRPYQGRFNPNPYYYRSDTHAHVSVDAKALLAHGLIAHTKGFGDNAMELTEEGKAFDTTTVPKPTLTPMWKLRFGYGTEITEVAADKLTAESIWIKGSRQKRFSDYESFYESWSDAKDAWVKRLENQIRGLQIQIDGKTAELEKARNFTQP